MAKIRESLKKQRAEAAYRQRGKCFYCGQPMWTDDQQKFAERFGITISQARLFECTGEHLIPHKNGGRPYYTNIVAACLYCNQRRHRRKKELDPAKYKEMVQKRLMIGRWRCFKLNSQKHCQ